MFLLHCDDCNPGGCSAEIASFGGVGDEVLFCPQGGGEGGEVAVTPLHSSTGQSVAVLRGHVDDVSAVQVRARRPLC